MSKDVCWRHTLTSTLAKFRSLSSLWSNLTFSSPIHLWLSHDVWNPELGEHMLYPFLAQGRGEEGRIERAEKRACAPHCHQYPAPLVSQLLVGAADPVTLSRVSSPSITEDPCRKGHGCPSFSSRAGGSHNQPWLTSLGYAACLPLPPPPLTPLHQLGKLLVSPPNPPGT